MADKALPIVYWRWAMARETGWSLEYIDGLSMGEWHDFWQIVDAEHKARQALRPYTTSVRMNER